MSRKAATTHSLGTSLNRVILGFYGLALLIILGLGYQSMVALLEREALRTLEELMTSREDAESQLFETAGDNVHRLKAALLTRLEQIDASTAEVLFHQYFARSEDGLWRVRGELDDHTSLPSLYIQHDAELTPSLYRRAIASYQLLKERGPALVPPYYSVYMDFVERGLMVYSPFVNWGGGATRETDNYNYPTMIGSRPENNPERDAFWTPVYFDEEARVWMVSVIEPLDWEGEWVGTVGHDVAIDKLIEQTLDGTIEGTYDMVLSGDNELIVHPDFIQQINDSQGNLSLDNLDDPELSRINRLVTSLASYPAVIADPRNDNFYGVAKIRGPDWLLVTVYPGRLIDDRIQDVLFAPMVAALLLIVAALFMLRGVITRLIVSPLAHLDTAVDQLAKSPEPVSIPIQSDNEYGRLARSFEDLSERLKQREASIIEARNDWRRTFDSVLELIAIVDTDFVVKQANRSFFDCYRLPPDGVIGHERLMLLTDTSRPIFKQYYELMKIEKEVQHFSAHSARLNIRFDVTLVPLLSPQGKLMGIVEVARDVTEHRRLEDQLRQSQKMDAIGQLAGGVAHDFNNLLQVILGCAEELELADTSQDEYSPVQQIIKASSKAAALTGQLLAFGRQQYIQTEKLNLNQLVQSTLNMVNRLIESNIRVTFTPARQPLIVNADANQLDQVLINLCVNARDAMPEGGQLEISVERVPVNKLPSELVEHSEGYARILVRDTGTGIEKEVLENVFEPFFTTKDIHKGTGLGLATAYGIVQQHGGTIDVSSEPGKGSEFRIYLPLVDEMIERAESSRDVSVGQHEGKRVLVVDDDEEVRELTRRVLNKQGYAVLTAADGEEAIRVFKQHHEAGSKIDLLVVDMMMPGLTGKDVIRILRKDFPQLPCLLASGYSEEQQREGLEVNLATRLITKPFAREQLLKEVNSLLSVKTLYPSGN